MSKLIGKIFGSKPTILLVDDDPAVAESLKPILSDSGYRVEAAYSGKDALAKAADVRPALIILDIKLPDIPGDAVAMRLSNDEDLRNIPIIILSAVDSIQERVVASYSGVVGYLVKPYEVGELLEKIEKAIAGSRDARGEE